MYSKYFQSILNDLLKSDKKQNESTVFLTRLGAHFSTFMECFESLYGKHPSYNKSLENFISIIKKYNNSRSNDLKELDLKREKDQYWFLHENMVAMMLYVDRFNKDIKGLIDKIDYFEELGVNVLHLMPLAKPRSGENDGGYAVEDYLHIREDFGTDDEFDDFVSRCHKKGICVVIDMVLNHTADTHQWAVDAKKGIKKYEDYYYTYNDRTIPDLFEQTMPQVFPDNAPGNFTFCDDINKWVMSVFHNYQWDLNYTNPEVFLEILEILLEYANRGIDIIRLDAVAFLWKKIGTTSQNQKEAHVILQALKSAVGIVSPATAFIAEAIVSPEEIIKYFGEGKMEGRECDIAYNATFMVSIWDAIATKNARLTKNAIHHTPKKPLGATWLSYARCHDDIGLGFSDNDARIAGYDPFKHRRFLQQYYTGKFDGSISKGELFMYNPITEDARISGSLASLAGLETALENNDENMINIAISRIILIHSMILSIGGIPVLYYGDEIGTTNDYSFLKNKEKKHDNRWMHRPIINWDRISLRSKKGTIENRIFHAIKDLIAIRKTLPEFGDYNNMSLIETNNDHLLSYKREYKGNKTIVINNVSDKVQVIEKSIVSDNGIREYKNIASMEKTEYIDNKIVLPPYSFLWCKGIVV